VGSFVFSLFSLIPLAFGAPINVVNVVRAGTLLPANAFFSQLLGLRPLLRDDYIGTLVTISGVICFIMFVGPPAPEKTQKEFLHQISRPAPVVFTVSVLVIFFGSAGWMASQMGGHKRKPSRLLAMTVSIAISCSIAAMDIATKGWAAAVRDDENALESPLFWVSFITQAAFFIVSKWGMIYGCSRCDVLIFVPLNIVLNIFFAVAAGMVVLGEASQVPGAKSWFGLTASWLCVVAGILLLVSGPAQTQEDLARSLKQKPPADDAHSDSGGATDETTDTVDDTAAPDSEPASGHIATGQHLQPALWLFINQPHAIARLNRAHISAANTRRWWRRQVVGQLRKRQRHGSVGNWLQRHGLELPPEPESPESSLGSDSDSSVTPAEIREVC